MTLREVFEAIREDQGTLTVEGALEAAREAATPAGRVLHDRLDVKGMWDDAKAAEEARKLVIASMIRSVKMRVVFADGSDGGPPRSASVRVFHAIAQQDDPAGARDYAPVSVIEGDPARQATILREAEREFRAMYVKYRVLGELFASMAQSVLAEDVGEDADEVPAASSL